MKKAYIQPETLIVKVKMQSAILQTSMALGSESVTDPNEILVKPMGAPDFNSFEGIFSFITGQ